MRNLVIIVGVSVLVLLSACSDGATKVAPEKDPKINSEKVNKIMKNGIPHHIGVYDNLPEDIKTYLKKHPEMLKELIVGPDPRFMGTLDAADEHLGKVDKKDVKFIYEHENFMFTHLEPCGNGEEPPAYKPVPNKDIIKKLKNN
ncbi:hypothetical protein MUO14_07850 [Halobacillus shinanisalinarum]|uniref:Lipoprotein n=1 Tax=Halobacillus shinanisalinarum TaxID=2932258 RepID=A0ABY4H5H8_9BACI|nr:hypothetical protein [Halobacillus shinanisalinarum]UOQ94832.1 hypothetical protein MUO14_07850 [Halobacillus shinanisalinarum]